MLSPYRTGLLALLSSLFVPNASAAQLCEQPPIDCSGLLAETCRIYCKDCHHCANDATTEECVACAERRCDECVPYAVCTTSSTTETATTTTTGCSASNFVIDGVCTNKLVCKANQIDTGAKKGDCSCFSENMDGTRNKNCYRCSVTPNFSGLNFDFTNGVHRLWANKDHGLPDWLKQYWDHDEDEVRDEFRGFNSKCIACKSNTLMREDLMPPSCVKHDECPTDMAIYNPKQIYGTCEKAFVCNGNLKYRITKGANSDKEILEEERHGRCQCGVKNCNLCAYLSKKQAEDATKEGICRSCKDGFFLNPFGKCLSPGQCAEQGGMPTSDGTCDIPVEPTTAAVTTTAVTDVCADGTSDPQPCHKYGAVLCLNEIVGGPVRKLCPALCGLC